MKKIEKEKKVETIDIFETEEYSNRYCELYECYIYYICCTFGSVLKSHVTFRNVIPVVIN